MMLWPNTRRRDQFLANSKPPDLIPGQTGKSVRQEPAILELPVYLFEFRCVDLRLMS